MRYAQKMVCLLVLVLAASFGIGGCVLLYSDFAVQRSRAAVSDAAAHAQACTLLQTEIIDLQRRGVSIGDVALTARVEAQQRPGRTLAGGYPCLRHPAGAGRLPAGECRRRHRAYRGRSLHRLRQ